jgi:benzoyl-CoA reductase/2-hydroxyglutaryl-CoA dehydratase subunit BcrC/BadD/HgdB
MVNRSFLSNALNRLREDHGVESRNALKELADSVIASGNAEAIDSLNALNEELEKPQHSTNRLRTWLNSIVTSLPDVAAIAEAAAKVANLIIH